MELKFEVKYSISLEYCKCCGRDFDDTVNYGYDNSYTDTVDNLLEWIMGDNDDINWLMYGDLEFEVEQYLITFIYDKLESNEILHLKNEDVINLKELVWIELNKLKKGVL